MFLFFFVLGLANGVRVWNYVATIFSGDGYKQCSENALYWYSSENERLSLIITCPLGCENGRTECNAPPDVQSHDYKQCVSDDLYWFNSEKQKEDVYQHCGSSDWNASSKTVCKNGAVHQEYVERGCTQSDTSSRCLESQTSLRLKESCVFGCLDGSCLDQAIACSTDADCKGQSTDLYCHQDSVYARVKGYKCMYPGTSGASCKETDISNTRIEFCPEGCSNGKCAQSQKIGRHLRCSAGDLWWFDQNDTRLEVKENCARGCNAQKNSCISDTNDQAQKRCLKNAVYWFDSLGNQQALVEDCGRSSWADSSSFCSDENVHQNYIERRCDESGGAHCVQKTYPKQRAVCSLGCADGACLLKGESKPPPVVVPSSTPTIPVIPLSDSNVAPPSPPLSEEYVVEMAMEEKEKEATFVVPSFTDVPMSHWAYTAIHNLASQGRVTGYADGTYLPSNIINRVEALKIILADTAADEPVLSALPFTDVDTSAWYAPYIQFALSNAITQGFQDGTFRPAQSITRSEFLKIAMLAQGFSPETPSDNDMYYTDVSTSDWFAPYVVFAFNNKLFHECTFKSFCPHRAVTRAEASFVMYRLIQMKQDLGFINKFFALLYGSI